MAGWGFHFLRLGFHPHKRLEAPMMTRGSNPLPPARMTAAERRRELCTLLGYGLVRLHLRPRDLFETAHGSTSCPTTHRAGRER